MRVMFADAIVHFFTEGTPSGADHILSGSGEGNHGVYAPFQLTIPTIITISMNIPHISSKGFIPARHSRNSEIPNPASIKIP